MKSKNSKHEDLVTQAKFAKLMGVSRQSVTNWKLRGSLVLSGDLVDVAASREKLAKSTIYLGEARRGAARGAKLTSPPDTTGARPSAGPKPVGGHAEDSTPPPPPHPDFEGVEHESISERADAFAKRVLAGRYVPLAEAETIKANAIALKHILDARAKSGELVSKQAVMDASFEAARRERNQWLNWPARVGPLLAADLAFDPDKLVTALAGYVHEMLCELGEPEIDLEDAR